MIARELHQAVLARAPRLQRHVGGAEVDRLRVDLLDAAARADRLVVHADAGLLLVGVRPLGVDRIGEGRAGAGDVCSERAETEKSAAAAKPSARCGLTFSMSLKPLKVKVGDPMSGQKICAQHCRFMTTTSEKTATADLERLDEQLLNVHVIDKARRPRRHGGAQCRRGAPSQPARNSPSPLRWNRRSSEISTKAVDNLRRRVATA